MHANARLENKILHEEYKKDNYYIEYTGAVTNNCVVFFTSGAPFKEDTEDAIKAYLATGLSGYDWYPSSRETVIQSYASKIIYIRDIFKSFYLLGINRDINNIDKLITFLQSETAGYTVTGVGSCLGAYAALICGARLSFNKLILYSTPTMLGYFVGEDRFITQDIAQKNNQYLDLRKFFCSTVQKTDVKMVNFFGVLNLGDLYEYKQLYASLLSRNITTESAGITCLDTRTHGASQFEREIRNKLITLDAADLCKFNHECYNKLVPKLIPVEKAIGVINKLYNSKI